PSSRTSCPGRPGRPPTSIPPRPASVPPPAISSSAPWGPHRDTAACIGSARAFAPWPGSSCICAGNSRTEPGRKRSGKSPPPAMRCGLLYWHPRSRDGSLGGRCEGPMCFRLAHGRFFRIPLLLLSLRLAACTDRIADLKGYVPDPARAVGALPVEGAVMLFDG